VIQLESGEAMKATALAAEGLDRRGDELGGLVGGETLCDGRSYSFGRAGD
jgi:hypothetical protein